MTKTEIAAPSRSSKMEDVCRAKAEYAGSSFLSIMGMYGASASYFLLLGITEELPAGKDKRPAAKD